MSLDYYYFLPGAPSRSVLLLAKELGLDLQMKFVDLLQGEQLKSEFIALNPQHVVPTLDDNGFVLWESRAILQYLQNKYGRDDSLYPTDPQKRALVDHRLFFDEGTLYDRLMRYFYPVFFFGQEHFVAAQRQKIEEALGWLDEFIGQSGGWVAGPHKTIADYSIVATVSNIEQMCGPHKIDLSKFKNVDQWFAKCRAELKDYEEAINKGAVQWGGIFKLKSEGKEIK